VDLSVIIVNYNVRHFLEQCLLSVRRASQRLNIEVLVVDNNSVDGSVELVQERFPEVTLIANKQNTGFSRANNQAIRVAKGRYVLLLNPDTVVQEDTFEKTVAFMDTNPKAGALGVRMLNGKGEFLPESKRSLPTPWVAFYKIFGLARMFPKSHRFGRYHLTYLSEEETNEVEVLSGAFMLMRKTVLDQVGLLDEDYFMYGEDIDLSYRITKGGYKNFYFADTNIIHYKGESTKKGSLNYVLVFYNAMLIFARKHFSRNRQRVFMLLIHMAIYLRASMAIGRRVVEKAAVPTLEFGLFWTTILGVKSFWEAIYKAPDGHAYYPPTFDYTVAPAYAGIFVTFLVLLGGYKRPYAIRSVAGSTLIYGFISIALLSFLMPSINYSRAIVALSSLACTAAALGTRGLHNMILSGSPLLDRKVRRRTVIAGDPKETGRVIDLIENEIFYECDLVGVVTPHETKGKVRGTPIYGEMSQLDEIVRLNKVEEIIFCNRSLSTRAIIDHMSALHRHSVDFKIVPNGADYLIGPNSILTAAGSPVLILKLYKLKYRFLKQLFERGVASGLLLAFPLTFWLYHSPGRAFNLLSKVLAGQYYLVGYIDGSNANLPPLKTGLLNMSSLVGDRRRTRQLTRQQAAKLDAQYARHYSIGLDCRILLSGLRLIGAPKAA